MAAVTTSRTARLLAVMNKGDDGRPGQPGHCRGSVTRKAPGALDAAVALLGCLRGSRNMRDASSPRQARGSRRRTARPRTLAQAITSSAGLSLPVSPVAAWLPGVRTVAEVGVGEAVVVFQARAEEPVQADVGEPDQTRARAMTRRSACQ